VGPRASATRLPDLLGRAGNPYFIDLDELALAGLLNDKDLARCASSRMTT